MAVKNIFRYGVLEAGALEYRIRCASGPVQAGGVATSFTETAYESGVNYAYLELGALWVKQARGTTGEYPAAYSSNNKGMIAISGIDFTYYTTLHFEIKRDGEHDTSVVYGYATTLNTDGLFTSLDVSASATLPTTNARTEYTMDISSISGIKNIIVYNDSSLGQGAGTAVAAITRIWLSNDDGSSSSGSLRHLVSIDNVFYKIKKGMACIDLTSYTISGGKARVDDTIYDLKFGASIEDGFNEIASMTGNACQYNPLYVNDTFFILSHSSMYSFGEPYWSKDGINWTEIPMTTDEDPFTSVAYGNGVYVIGGRNGGKYSTDLTTWTDITTTGYLTGGIRSGSKILFGNGIFIRNQIDSSSNTLISAEYQYSVDGVTWLEGTLPVIPDSAYTNFNFVNDRFLVTGIGSDLKRYIFSSVNGINWTTVGTFPIALATSTGGSPIVYGNGRYVFVDGQHAYYSTNGTNWSQTAVLETFISGTAQVPVNPNNPSLGVTTVTLYRYYHDPSGIVYANGLFVSGRACSTDGITWDNDKVSYPFAVSATIQPSVSMPTTYTQSTNLGEANGYFVVSEYASHYQTHALRYAFSKDCVNWTTGEFPFPVSVASTVGYTGPWSKIIYGNDIYLATELGSDRLETDPYLGCGAVAIIK